MRSIRRLEPETASRIAAGEVIERPLSALKEILENALDAGARHIEVRVKGALDRSFSVADDGSGIVAAEMELALERHATSKLARLEDLDHLDSLGFRGEALPSIAAVSRLRLLSRPSGSAIATWVRTAGGHVVERGESGRAAGTTVEVEDLFYNTPARRKFLHTPAGELRAALRMLEAMAFGYPDVDLRLLVDERERFHWPAAASFRERASAVWGPHHAGQLLEALGERNGIRVEGLLGLPEHARTTREGQIYLVNRRWVSHPTLAQALRQAYGNLLPHGRFPIAVLWITVPPERLDVNVHPTKREVRFAADDELFGLVAGACALPLASYSPPFTVVRGHGTGEPRWADQVREKPVDPSQLGLGLVPPARTVGGGTVTYPASPLAAGEAAAAAEPELWQLHRTYILAPVRGGLVIVDQHAAHERILYEEARARLESGSGSSQQLLFPALVDLTRQHFDLLLEVGPWLQQLGWDVAPLGPPTVVIQGIPSGLRHERPGQLLLDLLEGLGTAEHDAAADVSERLARSWACHAAVKAGDALSSEEMRTLVDRLFATSRPHGDPHGRVTYVRLDLDELHRRFGRT
ncbi:MAG: DNA mismatch repair endonuclease MutL [Candidatus Eisenbacteria bacterium]